MSSFCSAKATHIFSAKNIRILYIESAKTVNEMTLNELVKGHFVNDSLNNWALNFKVNQYTFIAFVCVCEEVIRPSQPNWVMSSTVSLPNHTFTRQV